MNLNPFFFRKAPCDVLIKVKASIWVLDSYIKDYALRICYIKPWRNESTELLDLPFSLDKDPRSHKLQRTINTQSLF